MTKKIQEELDHLKANAELYLNISQSILNHLKHNGPCAASDICDELSSFNKASVQKVLQSMLYYEELKFDKSYLILIND